MIIRILFFVCMSTSVFAQTDSTKNSTPAKENTDTKDLTHSMPEFPGGEKALYKFIQTNLKYPNEARKAGIEGRVFVEFMVEKDGAVTNVKAVKSPHEVLSAEAVRVVSMLPAYKPGTQSGKPIRIKLTIPIQFDLK